VRPIEPSRAERTATFREDLGLRGGEEDQAKAIRGRVRAAEDEKVELDSHLRVGEVDGFLEPGVAELVVESAGQVKSARSIEDAGDACGVHAGGCCGAAVVRALVRK